jgi:hypothetical protein
MGNPILLWFRRHQEAVVEVEWKKVAEVGAEDNGRDNNSRSGATGQNNS